MKEDAMLEEGEAWDRICASARGGGTIAEVYDFGSNLLKDAIERVKIIESKAISLAAYGTVVVTLLVSSSSSWIKLGNIFSVWIAVFAALGALVSAAYCVNALLLLRFSAISQEDWLKRDYLTDKKELKKYWTLNRPVAKVGT